MSSYWMVSRGRKRTKRPRFKSRYADMLDRLLAAIDEQSPIYRLLRDPRWPEVKPIYFGEYREVKAEFRKYEWQPRYTDDHSMDALR